MSQQEYVVASEGRLYGSRLYGPYKVVGNPEGRGNITEELPGELMGKHVFVVWPFAGNGLSKLGPYEVKCIGAGVWAGITDSFPAAVVGKEIHLVVAVPKESPPEPIIKVQDIVNTDGKLSFRMWDGKEMRNLKTPYVMELPGGAGNVVNITALLALALLHMQDRIDALEGKQPPVTSVNGKQGAVMLSDYDIPQRKLVAEVERRWWQFWL